MSNRGRVSFRDHHHYNHPSFSSTLLEEIYRSFDEEPENHRTEGYRMMKKSSSSYLERDNRFIVDQWIENDNRNLRRTVQSDGKFRRNHDRRQVNYSSSTSSSDSSSVIGGLSFSDTESLYGYSSKLKQRPPGVVALKPIRTAVNSAEFHRKRYSDEYPAARKKKEGSLQRRALKLYGDLKKVKQPISPGGKLATFLNSLFNSGASKKPKCSSSSPSPSPATPSTASKS